MLVKEETDCKEICLENKIDFNHQRGKFRNSCPKVAVRATKMGSRRSTTGL